MSRSQFHDDDRYVVVQRPSSGVPHFLLGVAIGACAALLMAPQSGEDTRRAIKRRAARVKRAAEQAATDVADSVTEKFDDARRRVEAQIESVRDEVDLKRRQVHRAMDAGRVAAREARVELESRLAETKAAYEAGADVARSARAARAPRPDQSEEG
ncbi:MAG TPA: YtxH domain-containing protein [Gemmatimonadaceae bacterium]|jgi:gas vesicle protein|nr:YtxH domain-containing protein [Gemmatimonadaceae bacterium]